MSSRISKGSSNESRTSSRSRATPNSTRVILPRIPSLHTLCDQADKDDPESWEIVRRWFHDHSADDATKACLQAGSNGTTALHLSCKNFPPLDVIEYLLNACQSALECADAFGCLPLHYACHHGASEEVLQTLIQIYPDAMTVQDTKGRNPLHFAVGNTSKDVPFNGAIITMLSQTGAASGTDMKGMLPLHYACAYGAPTGILEALTNAHVDAISAQDNHNMTPLHFSMGNCERPESPIAINFLLSKQPDLVNVDVDRKHHPLHALAKRSSNFKQDMSEEERGNALKCLDLFLSKNPKATPNYLTALQSLPKFLLDRAVVNPSVQELLNDNVSKKFPTAVMMFDFYALVAIVVTYSIAVIDSIDNRYERGNAAVSSGKIVPMYLGAIYFTFREIIQILSFIHLNLFTSDWLRQWTNWIDLLFIFLVYFWAIVFDTGGLSPQDFRTGAALSLFLLWLNILNFLRNLLVDFAVFSSGLIHVVRRLGTFVMAILIILIAFMQMFYTIFQQTSVCEGFDDFNNHNDTNMDNCTEIEGSPYRFCSRWDSFMNVYTMLLGEVDEGDFATSQIGTFLYCLFVFLCVILLANVLIAIVTDSYGVIRNERAEIVFWANRLDFVVEMDVISSGPWKEKVAFLRRSTRSSSDSGGNYDNGKPKSTETSSSNENKKGSALKEDIFSRGWKQLMDLFDEDVYRGDASLQFRVLVTLIRFGTIFLVIPLWFALGFVTAGLLWPPQVRKIILQQSITAKKQNGASSESQHIRDMEVMKKNVHDLRERLSIQISESHMMIADMRTDVMAMKSTLSGEIQEIKELVNSLAMLQQQQTVNGSSSDLTE